MAAQAANGILLKSGGDRVPNRIKVLEVELNAAPEPLGDLEGYKALRVLVRLHGDPVGHVEVPLLSGVPYTAADLRRLILRRLTRPILRRHLVNRLEAPLPAGGVDLDELLETARPSAAPDDAAPLVTVAVCTRDRAEDLRLCLDALMRTDYPRLDVLIVDNAPTSDATERLVRDHYPQVRYAHEPRPGLDWARNRAIQEARGEIIAYTDDDVVVDPSWVSALVEAFRDSHVMAVTGLTVPYELESEAQVLFERYGGFGRGYRRRYWRMPGSETRHLLEYLGGGRYGAGANMAFRRSIFKRIGYFDPALDVGTVTNGGGDTEIFFRVLKEGHTLVYEPGALVRHRHRKEFSRLRKQMVDNSIGLYSYLVRTALAYPETRLGVLWFGVWWFWRWNVRRLLASLIRPPHGPRELIFTEMWYSLVGLGRYQKARRAAERIASDQPYPRFPPPVPAAPRQHEPAVRASVGVWIVELGGSLNALEDVDSHTAVRVFATCHGEFVGFANVQNLRCPVDVSQLREALADQIGHMLLRRERGQSDSALWADVRAALERRYLPPSDGAREMDARLPGHANVSIVIPTYDRPQDLRACLLSVMRQATARSLEIIVVDNHPVSGLTPPVVAEFPGVVLLDEARRGRAYASNTGFAAASGEIIVSIDDDMEAPPGWLENLVAPFVRPDVVAVTGNTLPFELDTRAQQLFEDYGGFWRGVQRWQADGEWLESFRRRAVPTWKLGGMGNAAFRANVLTHPQIGQMDEALGAGMPTGTGEDIYFFYKLLRAGYAIAYEPSAYAWHKHRRDMRDLRAQIYSYSKGHVAYHLMTLLRDRDLRAAGYVAVWLPRWHLRQLARYAKRRLLFRRRYPIGLILTEICGNLAGPWVLWRSYRLVKRQGRSKAYVPVARRTALADAPRIVGCDARTTT
jgi:O-antigen biosynthesis protein